MRLYPLSKYKGNDFLRNNPFCNNLLSLIFRYFSVIFPLFIRSSFALPSFSLHIIYKVSSLILHCFSIVTMDNLWTIYGQSMDNYRMKNEGRTKEEQRKNRLVALKGFAQFVECLQVVFIQFSSPAHIIMLQLSASGLFICHYANYSKTSRYRGSSDYGDSRWIRVIDSSLPRKR